VFYAPHADAPAALAQRAAAAGRSVAAVDNRAMDSLSETRAPQGVVAVVGFLDQDASSLKQLMPAAAPGLALVLHDVADPGNAGTLVRCAEAFSVAAACFGPASVEPYNGKLVRATAGAFFRLPIVRYADWASFKAVLTGLEVCIVAAQAGAPDVRDAALPARCALVVGHERHGLDAIPASDTATRVGVPQAGSAESLNAGLAGAIVMYEISRKLRLIRRIGPACV